jgi:hypothetical protein
MRHEKVRDGAVEHHHLNVLVPLQIVNERGELVEHLRIEQVDRRIVQRDAPVLRGSPGDE